MMAEVIKAGAIKNWLFLTLFFWIMLAGFGVM